MVRVDTNGELFGLDFDFVFDDRVHEARPIDFRRQPLRELVAATLMRVRAGMGDADAMVEARRRLRFWAGDPDAPMWRAQ